MTGRVGVITFPGDGDWIRIDPVNWLEQLDVATVTPTWCRVSVERQYAFVGAELHSFVTVHGAPAGCPYTLTLKHRV